MPDNIVSIVGAVSGCLSLFGLVYLFGIWRGKVDSALNELKNCIKNYPPAEMWTMTKTLWDIYVVDALRNRPDLAEHQSAYKLRKEGEDLIPEHLKAELCQISKNPSIGEQGEAIASGWLVVKCLGMEAISRMAEEKELSIQESIAILSTYLVNNKGV